MAFRGPPYLTTIPIVKGLMIDQNSAFNFAIPELPYISGREFVGEIVQKGASSTRLKLGDRVCVALFNLFLFLHILIFVIVLFSLGPDPIYRLPR